MFSPPSGATPEPSLIGATPVFSPPSGATLEPSLIGATPVFSPPSGAPTIPWDRGMGWTVGHMHL